MFVNRSQQDDFQRNWQGNKKKYQTKERWVIAERTKFLETRQHPDGAIVQFVHRLKERARYSEFERLGPGEMTTEDELIMLRWIEGVAERKNFKLSFSAGIVLAVGVSNLYISSNENNWCHSARVTSPGNIKGDVTFPRPPLFLTCWQQDRPALSRRVLLSLLPGPIPEADRWTFQHTRAHSTFGPVFL